MEVDQASIISLFLSLLGNSTDKNVITAQVESQLDLRDHYECEGDWVRDDIVVNMPMEVRPGFLGIGQSGVYTCGDKSVAVLVTVYELALTTNATDEDEVFLDETIQLNCSVQLTNGAGGLASDMRISDSLGRQSESRLDSVANGTENELLTLLAERTVSMFGPNVFYCMWNVKVYTPDEEFIRNFAVIVSLHVKEIKSGGNAGGVYEEGDPADHTTIKGAVSGTVSIRASLTPAVAVVLFIPALKTLLWARARRSAAFGPW